MMRIMMIMRNNYNNFEKYHDNYNNALRIQNNYQPASIEDQQ